ncbi:major facilitator superfamily domain-containing protein, partial [Coniochaeta sp. 2T2.1]
VNVLIGGITIVGVAASTQLSFSFLLGELVPMKWRFLGNAYLYVYAIPFSGLAPVIAQSLASRGQSGWRWCFYIMIIINALSLASYIAFYHPPTFDMINKRQSRKAMIKNFDYVGTVLFTGGGRLSSRPLAYMPIKEPLVPMKLFLNTDWTASTLLLSIGASIYYAFSIVWPQMAAGVYGVSGTRLGWISSIVPGCILLGQIVGGALAKWIGHTRYQTMFVISVGGALLAAVAAAKTDSMGLVMGLLIVGCFFIGWNESVTLVFAGMCITDQKEIGTAVGLAGSVRSAISTFATTIYTVVLSNRMTSTISSIVVPAVVEAGVLEEDIAALLALLGAGGDVSVIPGVDAAVAEVLRDAYKEAALQAFKTVFLTSLAFTGVGFVVSWWAPNVKSLMTDHVAVLVLKKKKGGESEAVGDTKQVV